MQLGFDVVAARSKRTGEEDDRPTQVPMRPRQVGLARNISADEKKARRQQTVKTAAQERCEATDERGGRCVKVKGHEDPAQYEGTSGAKAMKHTFMTDDEIARRQKGTPFDRTYMAARVTAGALDLFGDPEDYYFDAAQALYWYGADYHGGQASDLYSMMSTMDYHPGVGENGPEPDSIAQNIYEMLESGSVTPEEVKEWYERGYNNTREGHRRGQQMKTEAEVLDALSKAATIEEQQDLMTELNAIRTTASRRARADMEWTAGGAVVSDYLTPVIAHTRHTVSTDWLESEGSAVPADAEIHHAMTVEANLWFSRVSPEVKEDREEFAAQAMGKAGVVAGGYGEVAQSAARAFLDQVARLHRQAAENPMDEPVKPIVETQETGKSQDIPAGFSRNPDNPHSDDQAASGPPETLENADEESMWPPDDLDPVTTSLSPRTSGLLRQRAMSYLGNIELLGEADLADTTHDETAGDPGSKEGGEDDVTWPWEMDQNIPGSDASDVEDVETPGGESGYPQPKSGSVKTADLVGDIMDWEEGNMDEDREVAFFQGLVDSGMAWKLQGMYGRRATDLINAGLVHRSSLQRQADQPIGGIVTEYPTDNGSEKQLQEVPGNPAAPGGPAPYNAAPPMPGRAADPDRDGDDDLARQSAFRSRVQASLSR